MKIVLVSCQTIIDYYRLSHFLINNQYTLLYCYDANMEHHGHCEPRQWK